MIEVVRNINVISINDIEYDYRFLSCNILGTRLQIDYNGRHIFYSRYSNYSVNGVVESDVTLLKASFDNELFLAGEISASSPSTNIKEVTSDYTIELTDDTIYVTTSGVTITMLDATLCKGKTFNVKNISGGEITIITTLSQTIDNELIINTEDETSLAIKSEGSNFIIT